MKNVPELNSRQFDSILSAQQDTNVVINGVKYYWIFSDDNKTRQVWKINGNNLTAVMIEVFPLDLSNLGCPL